jgi:hypothetical protein
VVPVLVGQLSSQPLLTLPPEAKGKGGKILSIPYLFLKSPLAEKKGTFEYRVEASGFSEKELVPGHTLNLALILVL